MSIANTAMAGVFSSDNTIAQYAEEIWDIHAESGTAAV
jgi:glucan phosphorylase